MTLHTALSKTLRKLCACFPIQKNKILFSSYTGRGFSDSPKAIAEALLQEDPSLKLQWLVNTPQDAQTLPEGIRPVKNHGFPRFYALATSRVWVDNCRKFDREKRKGQYYLQTWHGFALKRIEKDAGNSLEDIYIEAARQDAANTDLMVSNSTFMTGIYQSAFWYSGEVAPYGSPRNDIFFRENPEIFRKVREFYHLPQDRKLLLYAPTFRADGSTEAYGLDADSALRACEKRWGGKWSALMRLHPNVARQSGGLYPYDAERILDATAYPDMQELLIAADLLITDYSSSMFDYALQHKPCIQFATDIEAYRSDRNFYFSLDALPFPLARSNEALSGVIASYDEARWMEAWTDFTARQGFCEDGHAARRCADWILAHTK